MNHYERLKVSPDAPAEVIRAAYRALAAKLHPDRQGATTGPDDAMHAQMAALNAAYEVLIDPKLRQEYDAMLAPYQPMLGFADTQPSTDGQGDFQASQYGNRVDMDWLAPKPTPVSLQVAWPPSRRTMIIGGGAFAMLLVVGIVLLWSMASQHQMEKALLNQYSEHPDGAHLSERVPDPPDPLATLERHRPLAPSSSAPVVTTVPGSVATAPTATARNAPAAHEPSAEELARMSDEELLKVLPALEAQRAANGNTFADAGDARKGRGPHPLDGKPLNLRPDSQMIEAEQAPPAAHPTVGQR